MIGGEFNILPNTLRRYLDCCAAGDLPGSSQAYGELKRFTQYVSSWSASYPRWIKMAMRVLGLPGGAGGLREPYRMPPDADLAKFADGLRQLGIAEIDSLASAE